MGAQQSNSTDPPKDTCYYELLGVPSQASESRIKKAYHHRALELHPDRNLDDVEAATQRFAALQAAYEVLSDPQERAWYDDQVAATIQPDHESRSLHTDFPPAEYSRGGSMTRTSLWNLSGLAQTTKSFSDDRAGFFGILRTAFDQLAAEETTAAAVGSDTTTPAPTYPSFGYSYDDYKTVVRPFYDAWSGFLSKNSFAWADKHRISDAEDRRIRRLMEKENKKLREAALGAFSHGVRSLVRIAKLRDPRHIAHMRTEQERLQSLRNAAAAQAAKSRAANNEAFSSTFIPTWAQPHVDHLDESEFSEPDDSQSSLVIECVLCKKSFKSEKQFEAHERSKKHTKAVQSLKRTIRRDDTARQEKEKSPVLSPPQAMT